MTVTASDLPRAFNVTNRAGTCPICREGFETGERAFYGVVRRGPDGSAMWTGEAQVAPRDARTSVRPTGCTCRGKRAHGKRCALAVSCACPTRNGRGRSRYQAHRRSCSNALSFSDLYATLPGFVDHAIHVECATRNGLVTPTGEVTTYGARTVGHFTTPGVGATPTPTTPMVAPNATSAPRATTPQTTGAPGLTEALTEGNTAAEELAATVREAAATPPASWVPGFSAGEDATREREAAIAARAAAVVANREAVAAANTGGELALDGDVERFQRLELAGVEAPAATPEAEPVNAMPADPGAARFGLLDLD